MAVDIHPDGEVYQWVVDSVEIAGSAERSNQVALDLDGNERTDNALGQILNLIFGEFDVRIDEVVDEMVADARILHLIELRATSLDTADGVGVRFFLGDDTDDDPTDNFSGSELFGIEPGNSVRASTGVLRDGQLDLELGMQPLRIALPGSDQPFTLQLESARIVAGVTADSMSGSIAGVITDQQVRETLLPIAYVQVAFVIDRDCGQDGCELDSSGETMVSLFDLNDDFAVSYAEFSESSFLGSLLAPDLDIYDEAGLNTPRCDGVKESLSVAVGFTAVRARFDAPQL